MASKSPKVSPYVVLDGWEIRMSDAEGDVILNNEDQAIEYAKSRVGGCGTGAEAKYIAKIVKVVKPIVPEVAIETIDFTPAQE